MSERLHWVNTARQKDLKPACGARRGAVASGVWLVNCPECLSRVETWMQLLEGKLKRVQDEVVRVENRSPVGTLFDRKHPELTASVLIPTRRLRDLIGDFI